MSVSKVTSHRFDSHYGMLIFIYVTASMHYHLHRTPPGIKRSSWSWPVLSVSCRD